ncbi:SNF2 domain-containing protein CLASSY 3-like [Andrographis paniculata]|uniref:SNF2 domain-containing protein CLASSY 3-like n=1 Tax=Andrographis paniculata TaxID=175694 RepID=UPI0021E8E56C|nr:SNF2 domain-containing protein CLASSY 3-like [Andrographis paniculata]
MTCSKMNHKSMNKRKELPSPSMTRMDDGAIVMRDGETARSLRIDGVPPSEITPEIRVQRRVDRRVSFDDKVDEELQKAQTEGCTDGSHDLSPTDHPRNRANIYAQLFGPELDGHTNGNHDLSSMEHLRSRADIYARLFGLELTVPELEGHSNGDSADTPSRLIAPAEKNEEVADSNGDLQDTVCRGNADDGIRIASDNCAGIAGRIRSLSRTNKCQSYELSDLSGDEIRSSMDDEDFTLTRRQKMKNQKGTETAKDSMPAKASGQRCNRMPKRKVAVNAPERKTKQRRISGICEGKEQRLESEGGNDDDRRTVKEGEHLVSDSAQPPKATRVCKSGGDGEDMPYWLKEMTKFMTGAKAKKLKPKRFDISKILKESILGQPSRTMHAGEGSGAADGAEDYPPLPKKFRFEEDVAPLTEKEQRPAEWEKELDDLFEEFNFSCAVEEIGTTARREVVGVDDEEEEESQERRCARGLHELVLEDDRGWFCICCQHVAIQPKDVIPPWAIKGRNASGKKKQEKGKALDLSAVNLPEADAAEISSWTSGSVWSIKPGVRESMYEHQQEGFEFLWRNLAGSTDIADLKNSNLAGVGGCIISHAPGTGKTRLMIVFLETYLKMYPNCLPMIIAPAGLLQNWEGEFRKWNSGFNFHNLNNLTIIGDEMAAADHLFQGTSIRCRDMEAIRMVKIYSWKRGGGLLGISYSLFEKLTAQKNEEADAGKEGQRSGVEKNFEVLRSILLEMPGLVILDEGHTPRNRRSKIWTSLVQLKTEKRVILSGTLFQNNFRELFNSLKIVRPTVAEAAMQDPTFSEILHSDRNRRRSRPALLPESINRAVERLKVSMAPFVHVHKGSILQKSLPGLRDCVVLLKSTGLQKNLIDLLEGERLRKTIKSTDFVFSLVSVHPYLIQRCKSQVPTDGIDMQAAEASKLNPSEGVKTKFIVEFVRLSMTLKEKVLIFSQYLPPLDLIEEHLTATFQWNAGKEILRLEGKLEKKQRQNVINAFNDPENDSMIMLASTKCCSEGISLVGASRVILLDVLWNPSVQQQAICRAYRIGQNKFVHTYHLMTAGTTEADKYCRQAEKERLSELVFCSSSNEQDISKQPMAEIEDKILEAMVKHGMTKDMFEKIIHQPKTSDLIQSLGLRG